MSPDRGARLWPSRRAVLLGIGTAGAGALALRPARLRGEEVGAADDGRGRGVAAARFSRAILYEEEASNPTGSSVVGQAVWSATLEPAKAGVTPEIVVRASVAIPERDIVLNCTLRRNRDTSLPASHTLDLMFTLPPGFSHGGIASVPGLLMKTSAAARGVPLRGVSAKVTDGYYIVGLSVIDAERKINLQLLREREWFDVPIVFDDGRRAILAFEKGEAGERALDDAFADWESAGQLPERSGGK
jgi:hypothetical protein